MTPATPWTELTAPALTWTEGFGASAGAPFVLFLFEVPSGGITATPYTEMSVAATSHTEITAPSVPWTELTL